MENSLEDLFAFCPQNAQVALGGIPMLVPQTANAGVDSCSCCSKTSTLRGFSGRAWRSIWASPLAVGIKTEHIGWSDRAAGHSFARLAFHCPAEQSDEHGEGDCLPHGRDCCQRVLSV